MVIPLPQPEEISLYFHVPFCKKKCGYCHFFVVKDDKELHESLVQGFIQEIKRAAPILKKRKLVSIYFGGGTPSLLSAMHIETVLNEVTRAIAFSPSDTEITMEFNPESCSKETFHHFKSAGINRASIGIQSFDDALLLSLTREHSAQKGRDAVLASAEAGIDNITIDLMYEIPGQTKKSWDNTLQTATDLPITHLSLYNLTFEEGTSFYRKKSALSLLLPSDEEAKDMLLHAVDHFERENLHRYEISAFAKTGFYSRHNTGYWLGREFFGFGPSAFSYLGGKRLRNTENLKTYLKLCKEGDSPIDFEEELEREGKLRELFTISLRLSQGVAIKEFEERFMPLSQKLMEEVANLEKKEFLRTDGARISLTEKGRLFFNDVASELI
ncbi:radical SAM family heme chaperone HemW [Estrella lausannensis]|uniref:Heme chaperone HemW n=1 Tax=Estrella lausannensis TaxID=483423 RepID=A0A0H5E7C7_9BACT|nr:radical SAM family heme chaperone HemW [Estrella lausannensis]CRX39235.1 putative coproporphyrinogen III oxidase [Estrella lausannensis]